MEVELSLLGDAESGKAVMASLVQDANKTSTMAK
jgi:hypothetical protein